MTTGAVGRGFMERKVSDTVRVFYSPRYVASGYAFDTTRKAKWIADSLTASPIPGIELSEPESLTQEQIASVHDPDYVRAVETGHPREWAQTQGFTWDAGLWPMVRATNGGAVAAAITAMEQGVSGSLSSGLHHARHGRGAGFCTFNGLVLAAQAALAAGATSVLILDLDAHCGGGTASLIVDEPRIWQLDVSVSLYDCYPDSEQAWRTTPGSGAEYLPTVQQGFDQLDRRGLKFDLCLYNAGMDPCQDCETGGHSGITPQILADREWLVFEWCRGRGLPIAFVLAGGYVGSRLGEAGLVDLHRLTLAAAAGLRPVPATL